MSRHPTVVLSLEYLKKHPEARGQMILFEKNGNEYVVTGHRPMEEWEKNLNKWCCDPGNCSTHKG